MAKTRSQTARSITGAEALVDSLAQGGVNTAFTVPGESFLGVLDALHDRTDIRTVATRHEGAAAFMAEATGKLTGRPGVCMATRAVGALNLGIGIHTAMQDSSPLIALLGQVPTSRLGREAFQEADLADVFRPMVKWAIEPTQPNRLGEIGAQAVRVATQGRPGPVVLSLPEDILPLQCDTSDSFRRPARSSISPPLDAVAEILKKIRTAAFPLVVVGAGVLERKCGDAVAKFAELESVGVVTGWRRPDAYPNDDYYYLGHSGLRASPSVRKSLDQADFVLVIGHRLDESTTLGYTFPKTETYLVVSDVSEESLASPRGADLTVIADAESLLDSLIDAANDRPDVSDIARSRESTIKERRKEWVAETTPVRGRARQEYADQTAIAKHIRSIAPSSTIFTSDAGTFSGWLDRYIHFSSPGTFLGPISGAMGYGLPAAIAAKIQRPDQPVVSYIGDGGFLMTGSEIETAVREQTPLVALVFDNQKYATIGIHQERHYPGRPVATELGPVDFAEYSRSLGAEGYTVNHDSVFSDAFSAALKSESPCVIHIKTDPEQISVNDDSPIE